MKNFLITLLIVCIFFISWCSTNSTNNEYVTAEKTTNKNVNEKKSSNYIIIKYRDTSVDVSEFESFNTSKSSFIEEAYYDSNNQYLILNLNWTNYHWCNVPDYVWNDFKKANSLWKYYNKYIKWEYDCRLWNIPQYK